MFRNLPVFSIRAPALRKALRRRARTRDIGAEVTVIRRRHRENGNSRARRTRTLHRVRGGVSLAALPNKAAIPALHVCACVWTESRRVCSPVMSRCASNAQKPGVSHGTDRIGVSCNLSLGARNVDAVATDSVPTYDPARTLFSRASGAKRANCARAAKRSLDAAGYTRHRPV